MAAGQAKNPQDSSTWSELYIILPRLVKRQVHDMPVSSWSGQEYDLTQDIVQETVVRTFIQMQKAESGKVPPVVAPEYFSKRVARNRLFDIARKESRLVRPSIDIAWQEKMMEENWIDSCEDVLDDMEITSLFMLIAQVIAEFPEGQRKALLMDLADRTPEDEPFRPLQQALKSVNINLDLYRNLVPTSIVEKQRYASLLSLAYRRVKITVLDYLRSQGGDCSA